MSTDVYLDILEQFWMIEEGCFQQDGRTCDTSARNMAEIESFFCSRVISKGLWPPRLPDVTPVDFFLWEFRKCEPVSLCSEHVALEQEHKPQQGQLGSLPANGNETPGLRSPELY
ncbi:hypothetical protein AOLI_G00143060 [Acnodon oligacanthus]